MEVKEIKGKIKVAIDAVDDVPEAFKIKAFEVVLSKLLNERKFEANESEGEKGGSNELTAVSQSMDDKIKKMAEAAGVTVNQLNDIFQFGETTLKFIGRIEGKDAGKQVQISRLIIFAYKEVYGQEWVEGSIIREVLKDCGVGSLNHFSENLMHFENEFRTIGLKSAMKYKLTEPGKQTAITLLKQLVAT